MTNEQGGATEPCLLVRAEDGSAYAIPKSIVEAHRLSDELRAELEAQITADGADVQGFDYTSGGLWPAGTPTPKPLPQYDSSAPARGGWDGVGLRYIPATYMAIGKARRWP